MHIWGRRVNPGSLGSLCRVQPEPQGSSGWPLGVVEFL